MLLGFALRCSIDCRACRISIPLNGIVSSANCYHCGELNDFGAGFWSQALAHQYFVEILSLAAGERRSSRHLATGFRVEYGQGPILCVRCKSGPIDPQIVASSVARGECICSRCGASIRVRVADTTCTAIHPTARFVVGECAPDRRGQDLQANTKPVIFQCISCGGALHVDGSKRMVGCQFCSGDNYLPDGLWQLLNPVPKPVTFFLVCDIETCDERRERAARNTLGLHEVSSLAADQDEWVRRAIAVNPVTPPEILRKLAFDRSRTVLEGLAQNPNLPDELLEQMAVSDDAEFRALAASNPKLSLEGIRRLAADPNQQVARAAKDRIEALRAQGIEVEPKGFFAKLFG